MAAMPAPASSAARPHSADATPRRTSAGARPAWIQACRQAAVMSRTPQSSQPVTIAWRVVTWASDGRLCVIAVGLIARRVYSVHRRPVRAGGDLHAPAYIYLDTYILDGVYLKRGVRFRHHCGAEPPRDIGPPGLVRTVGWSDRASTSHVATDGVKAPARAARGRFRGIHCRRTAPSLPAET